MALRPLDRGAEFVLADGAVAIAVDLVEQGIDLARVGIGANRLLEFRLADLPSPLVSNFPSSALSGLLPLAPDCWLCSAISADNVDGLKHEQVVPDTGWSRWRRCRPIRTNRWRSLR